MSEQNVAALLGIHKFIIRSLHTFNYSRGMPVTSEFYDTKFVVGYTTI
jgi:hypothetical protein